MVEIKYNGKKYPLSTSYEELTLRQFFALRDNSNNVFKLLEILSGIPDKTWKYNIDIDLFDGVTPFISFIQNEPPAFDAFLMPDSIEIKGQRYAIPAGIGMKSLAQKLSFEDAIRSNKSDVDLIPTALAIYFQPDIDIAPFDEDRLEYCIDKILECKVNEAFPIAGFFFEKYKQYLKQSNENSATNQVPKKLQQVLIVSKSTGTMARFGLLRRLLILASRKLSEWIIIPVLSRFSTKKMKQHTNEPIKKS